jgi:hypothetical protein
VDRSTTGEIETSENKHPTVWVPRPTGNGIIDDSCPHEDEDAAREHASAFRSSANGKCGSNCGEHTLEDGEGEIRDVAGLLCQNAVETKVLEIANERTGGVGESK